MNRTVCTALLTLAAFTALRGAGAAVAPLELVTPRGGEVYLVGQSQQIRVNGRLKFVTLQLSRDGGATFIELGAINNTLIKDKTLQNLYKYTVTGPSASNCIVRARGLTAKGEVVVDSGGFVIATGNTLGLVVAADLADGSVTTPKLAAQAVTAAKVGSGPASGNMVLQADGSGGAFFGPIVSSGLPALSGDVTGNPSANVVTAVGGQSAAAVSGGAAAANAATSANVPGTIVKRDANGDFSAGTIGASILFPDGTSQSSALSAYGLNGTAKALTIDDVNGYTVPQGKTLFITTTYAAFSGALYLDGQRFLTANAESLESPMPIPGGTTVTFHPGGVNPLPLSFTATEVTGAMGAKAIVIDNVTGYTVPAGKTLYITTADSAAAGLLTINGNSFLSINPNTTRVLASPLIVPGGTTIILNGPAVVNATGVEK